MPRVDYDEMQWEISEFPIGFSTPDEFFENTYRAYTNCVNCNKDIEGEAHYWSREEDMIDAWLDRINYSPCECQEIDDDEDDY